MEDNDKNNERYIKSRYAIIKAQRKNPVLYEDKDGEKIELSDVAMLNISGVDINYIKQADGKIVPIIQVDGILKNGEKIQVILDENGKDMACILVDRNNEFKLTPRMEAVILARAVKGTKGKIDHETLKNALCPDTIEDFEKEIGNDTLIPKNFEETIKKIRESMDKSEDGNQVIDLEELTEEEKELYDEKEETTEEELLPDDVRDEVAKIRSKEGARLKHVLLTKDPSSISDKLIDDAGLRDNGEPVYCLSFEKRSLDIDSDRVVFVQGSRVIDDRKYDEDATRVLEPYRTSSVVRSIEDDENKVIYTDLDGHTFVENMVAEPRDLNLMQKDLLREELEKLDRAEDTIRSSDMSLDQKIEECEKINNRRIEIFDKYGLKLPEIRSEIRGDMQIGDEIQDDIEERESDEIDDDGYDPRETRHIRAERE